MTLKVHSNLRKSSRMIALPNAADRRRLPARFAGKDEQGPGMNKCKMLSCLTSRQTDRVRRTAPVAYFSLAAIHFQMAVVSVSSATLSGPWSCAPCAPFRVPPEPTFASAPSTAKVFPVLIGYCGLAHGLETTRLMGEHAGGLGRGIRAHARQRRGEGTRPQPAWFSGLVRWRGHQRRCELWRDG